MAWPVRLRRSVAVMRSFAEPRRESIPDERSAGRRRRYVPAGGAADGGSDGDRPPDCAQFEDRTECTSSGPSEAEQA